MKILHLISSEGYYGGENMLVTLAQALRARGLNCVVGVFHNRHQPHLEIVGPARESGLEVEIIPCRGRADWEAIHAIRRCMDRRRIELLHTHGYKADLYGFLAAHGRWPVVATCHNWTGQGPALKMYGVLDRLVLRFFDRVAAVSNPVAQRLRTAGVSAGRIRRIPNGIETLRFHNARPTLAEEIGKRGRLLVGMVARVVKEKGPELLLRAAQSLTGRFPEALFALVGDGPAREEMEALARELGIGQRVIFTGARRDMPGVYASLDLCVLPSWNEGLPLSVLEAMAAGVPVVTTRVGSLPEVVQPESTGLLIEPGDTTGLSGALARLLGDAELRNRLAQNGRRLVEERFSATRMAEEYIQVYEGLQPALRIQNQPDGVMS